MYSFENVIFAEISAHHVGNKTLGEDLIFSSSPLDLSEKTLSALRTYFLSSFKGEEFYRFSHGVDVELNTIYSLVKKFLGKDGDFNELSRSVAQYLYDCSEHPKIKGGDLFVAILEGCELDGNAIPAVGIFKSESFETFLKVRRGACSFSVEADSGIDVRRLDKGAIIFGTSPEEGYRVLVVDNTNRGADARYWLDDFLGLVPLKDEYYHTSNVMQMTKGFVRKELPSAFEVTKADQAAILARSEQYFKDNETFDMKSYTEEVIGQEDVIDVFNEYKDSWSQSRGLELEDGFEISEGAVKRQSRSLRSVIKLDKNFHIYVHGGGNLIRKGFDQESGMSYYQIFFDEES